MANPSKVKEAVDWYSTTRVQFETLAKKVELIIKETLESNHVNYHSITSRAKEIQSYRDKAAKEKYTDPRSQIFDMAGIRVVTYLESEALLAHEIAKSLFEFYPEHSVDRSEELGVDRVGYRSIHCVGTLGKKRFELPEYEAFKDMPFEIQIRTILQHAWAEFGHERNFKFQGVLPDNIKRRVSIAAGILEFVDKEFERLAKEIEQYSANAKSRIGKGYFSIPIDSLTLTAYMKAKFSVLVKESGGFPESLDKTIINELKDMGINTLEHFEKMIPEKYILRRKKHKLDQVSFAFIVRDVLMIHDIDAYFRKAWKKNWNWTEKTQVAFFAEYGIDFNKYAEKYNIDVGGLNYDPDSYLY